jgi:hypothetical protein
MRHAWSSVCAGLMLALVPLGSEATQAAGIRHQVAGDAQSAPPATIPPSTKEDGVIKPKTDVDPKIEKLPPNPNPDPENKDVIKPPPENGGGKPK